MAKNRKNIIIRIQDWIESVPGQTFLNYAYSWGAVSYTHLTLPTNREV